MRISIASAVLCSSLRDISRSTSAMLAETPPGSSRTSCGLASSPDREALSLWRLSMETSQVRLTPSPCGLASISPRCIRRRMVRGLTRIALAATSVVTQPEVDVVMLVSAFSECGCPGVAPSSIPHMLPFIPSLGAHSSKTTIKGEVDVALRLPTAPRAPLVLPQLLSGSFIVFPTQKGSGSSIRGDVGLARCIFGYRKLYAKTSSTS